MQSSRSAALSVAVVVVAALMVGWAGVGGEESINAYIASNHKKLFDEYNAVVFGDASLAKAAIRGTLAVQGRAMMAEFDVGADRVCDADKRSLVVGGALVARNGKVNNGYVVIGKHSQIQRTVAMPCTNRIERHNVIRNGDLDFQEMHDAVISESAHLCATPTNSNYTIVNSTMIFTAENNEFNCYSHFRVPSAHLRTVDTWAYQGDFYRNLVISVTGYRNEFKQFRMSGFNPRRTLVVFCAIYGTVTVTDAKMHASILAPSASFTTSNAIINGSIIVGGLRGSIATLNIPYVTC